MKFSFKTAIICSMFTSYSMKVLVLFDALTHRVVYKKTFELRNEIEVRIDFL